MLKDKLPQTFNHIFSTFSSRIIAAFLALITGIIIARILGPEIKGYLSVITLVGSICYLLGALGINSFNTYLAAKDKSKVADLFVNSFWFSLVISLICLILIFILYLIYPLVFHNIPIAHLFLYLFSLPFLFFYSISIPILAGQQKFRIYNFFTIFYPVLDIIFISFFLVLHLFNLKYLVAAYFLTNITSGILAFILIKPKSFVLFRFDTELFKQALNYGFKIYLAGIFSFLIIKADLYMVNLLRGATEAGLYSLVASFSDTFFLLPYSIAFIILPKAIKLESDKKVYFIAKYFSYTFYLSLVLSLGFFCFIKPIVLLLYGASFLPSAEIILIILPGLIFWSLVTILGQYFAATSYNIKIIIGWLFGFLLNIALNFIYIPQMGMKGAAISSVISYFLIFIYIFILFKKETKISLREMFRFPLEDIKQFLNPRNILNK
ncbi:MAG: polysaccharide biosynthesis C-terminal domain-containing protein [Candidatus Pacebacteria bacterium]|nr:polysaccharide biosynthesis C-terminal domain-containing protein [Candidatus Paceibacterota bacterium]